ncbi:MAG TPA: hypothetical protein VK106_02970 [Balneolaceae bacterium]|nr:hypothetical protein [Balneolaceae bacterium]
MYDQPEKIVNLSNIVELYDHDEELLNEFYETAIESFSKFKKEFRDHLLQRDLNNLRRVGHRIKPVAQTLGVEVVNVEYKKAKKYLKQEVSDEMLKKSVHNMESICDKIINEFKNELNGF